MNDIIVKFIPPKAWYRNSKWELQQSYTSNNGRITVPAGYISDGASIPFPARIFFSTTGKYYPAAIIHDYCITDLKNWKLANREFGDEMRACRVSMFTRMILLSAVTIRSWFR